MTPAFARPRGWTHRDMLCGVLAATAVHMKLPAALDVATKACEPLFGDRPVPTNWFPAISTTLAREAIGYAGRALRFGAMTKAEYDFVTDKARRALVREISYAEETPRTDAGAQALRGAEG